MPIIEIHSLTDPRIEIFSTLTEAQLRNRIESDKGLFIAESPKVINVAQNAGYEPLALLCEHYQHWSYFPFCSRSWDRCHITDTQFLRPIEPTCSQSFNGICFPDTMGLVGWFSQ